MTDREPLAGRYRLIGELGRGGMGTVWRARDEALDRDVAVKELVLPKESTEQRRELAVRRALREARAAAQLRHPGIVTVHDVVLADGRPWIVMELLSGRSLDKVVHQDGPLDPRRAAALGIEMLDALHAAHERGILHRDVKPANVFLRDDGRAVLTDFGIASLAGDAPLTRPGALIGSPAYMAPERVRGETEGPSSSPHPPPFNGRAPLDGSASDLWSLGVTLYALVEGRIPFGGSKPMGVLGAVLADAPTAPERAGPLSGTLLRLLAKDPDDRPGVGETRQALAEIAAGHETPRPWPVRGVVIAMTVLVCLVAAAATGFVLLRDDSSGLADSDPAATATLPYETVPSLCGLVGVKLMNPLVPVAGPVQASRDDEEYFDEDALPRIGSCEWNERSTLSDGYSASARTRPVDAARVGDPLKPARDDFAKLRAAAGPAGEHRGVRRALPGIGDEAFAYDKTTGEAKAGDYDAVVVFRTRNLVTKVEYGWDKYGARPPGGLERLREGAEQISRWVDAALRTGRPASTP